MGILDRFTTIIKANVNELLDRAEDPAKMVDQYLLDLSDSLAEVKEQTASVMAEEARCRREVERNEAEATRMKDLARKAVAAGNDDDARVFLAKRQRLVAAGEELSRALEAAHDNSVKMREMHDKLVSDIEGLKARREAIKSKMAVARTQEMITGYTSGSDAADGAIEAFGRMEAKADRMLDTAGAKAELGARPVDEVAELEVKYAGATDDAAVEDELARLKEEMGS